MATSHQLHPNPLLQKFIAAGERELANLEEPARTIRAVELHREMLRRFPPANAVEFDGLTEPPSDKEVEDAVLQDEQDKLEEKAIEGGHYTYGDEGSGEPRFVSHLRVKCMDSVKQPKLRCCFVLNVPSEEPQKVEVVLKPLPVNQFPQVFEQGPDKEIMLQDGLAFSEYQPTGPYHHRVANWMTQRSPVPKEVLQCQYCGKNFEGKKRQKFCSVTCGRRSRQRTPLPTQAKHVFGECECADCVKVFDLFMETRLRYLLEKYEVQELGHGMELDASEKQYILDFAKHQVKNNEQ